MLCCVELFCRLVGSIVARFGGVLVPFLVIWDGLGHLLGPLGGSWGGLRRPWGRLGGSWVHFCPFLLNKAQQGGATCAILCDLEGQKGPKMAPKMGPKTEQIRRRKRR